MCFTYVCENLTPSTWFSKCFPIIVNIALLTQFGVVKQDAFRLEFDLKKYSSHEIYRFGYKIF